MEKIKVHIIEDDPDDIFFVEEILLSSEDYQFQIETSGRIEEAEGKLKERVPDLVLLDLSLPDASGVELVSRVKALVPRSDVIVLTGNNDKDLGLKALKLGASDYVVKNGIEGSNLLRAILYSRERTKLMEQLMQSQKVEAIGQLAGGVVHDFNNQLAVMYLLIDEMKAENCNPFKISKLVSDLNTIVEKCSVLTRKILSFSRVQVSEAVIFDVNSLLCELLPFVQRLVGSSFSVEHRDSCEKLYVKINKNNFEQIVWNLAINARDASTDHGLLNIKACRKEINGERFVVIEFQDNGTGISDEIKEKIFNPFFTTKSENHGTGLGLSTISKIIQQNQGSINVKSKPGETVFQVCFPEVTEHVVLDSTSKHLLVEFDGSNKTVLLCDDEVNLLELVSSVLEDKGFTVLTAEDGEDGLAVYMDNKESIDLVITDLTMPKINGAQMAEAIRKVNSDVKIIFVSGYADGVDTEESVAVGARILGKPFTVDKLALLISEMFENSEDKRQKVS